MAKPREDDDLNPLLLAASAEDLGILSDYITDSGKGRISLDEKTTRRLVAAKARGVYTEQQRLLVAHEIQLFGGNSFANLARGGQGVVYRELLEDVAGRLKAKTAESDTVSDIESSILATVVSRAWEKMTDQEKAEFAKSAGVDKGLGIGPAALAAIITAIRTAGFSAYKLATVLANIVARQLLGRGLAFGAMAPFLEGMSVLAGPIGWAVTAIWTAYDLASPAYRVTVPCAIQIAYMRKKIYSATCPSCGSIITSRMLNLCSECGQKLSPENK